MGFNQYEINFIKKELHGLETSRQDDYSLETINEWINTFYEEGFSAEHCCRMIRKVKTEALSHKIRFSDFTFQANNVERMAQIIPSKSLPEHKEETNEILNARYRELLIKVRQNLKISFRDFLSEAMSKGQENIEWYEKYYEHLLENPSETKCENLESIQKHKNGIKLNQIINQAI